MTATAPSRRKTARVVVLDPKMRLRTRATSVIRAAGLHPLLRRNVKAEVGGNEGADLVVVVDPGDGESISLLARDARARFNAPMLLVGIEPKPPARTSQFVQTLGSVVAGKEDVWERSLLRALLVLLPGMANADRDHRVTTSSAASGAASVPASRSGGPRAKPVALKPMDAECIAIGISTGGPAALATLLPKLCVELPPIFVVQHMPPNFIESLAARLNKNSKLDVRVATNREVAKSGCVYLAPAGLHLAVRRGNGGLMMELKGSERYSGHVPSADKMYLSLADNSIRTLAVIMTGMGVDGAEGAARLYTNGNMVLAQDEHSCVVYGMPRAVVEAGNATAVLPLDSMAKSIHDVFSSTKARTA